MGRVFYQQPTKEQIKNHEEERLKFDLWYYENSTAYAHDIAENTGCFKGCLNFYHGVNIRKKRIEALC